jgi:ribokinase
MTQTQVFFIGDVALDEYYEAPYFPRLKDKVIVRTLKPEMGGMIANAACVFSSLGGDAGFIAALNPGFISKSLCENLSKSGIDTRHVTWDDTLPDSKTIIILAENEHTVFIPTLNLQKLELSESSYNALINSEYIYSNICEIKPLCYSNLKIEDILKEFKRNGVKLWFDLDVADISESDYFILNYIDTVFLNEKGKENLELRFKNTIEKIFFSFGIHRVILTEAEHGCAVFEQNKDSFKIDGVNVEVKDVTGAGDTFASSFLYSFAKTNDVRLAANFANYAAARAVTGKGARFGAVGVKTVISFMKSLGVDTKKYERLL